MVDNEEISVRRTAPFSLPGQQGALYSVLLEKDEQLAAIYLGSYVVLSQNRNTDRYAQASHSIRELIEKLPRLVDVPIIAQQESLKQKVIELEEVWKHTQRNSKCINDSKWVGEIDTPLSRALVKLLEFFEWFGTHFPRRKEEMAETLRGLDISGQILPAAIEDLNIQRWGLIRDFFVGVAHHRRFPINEEFMEWLNQLEVILLDLLLPRTFDDLDAIDTIIREGE